MPPAEFLLDELEPDEVPLGHRFTPLTSSFVGAIKDKSRKRKKEKKKRGRSRSSSPLPPPSASKGMFALLAISFSLLRDIFL